MRQSIELTFITQRDIRLSYVVYVMEGLEANEETMRNTVGGIMKLYNDSDCPVMTDVDGRVFCLPNLHQIAAIEIKAVP